MPQYKRPPITEAVVGIYFDQAIPETDIDRAQTKLREQYPLSDPFATVGIQVNLSERQTTFDEQSKGYKLTSLDKADVLIIASGHLTTSRLAPYTGWDAFRRRAQENWQSWKRVVGYRKIHHCGVRYINRIDIPAVPATRIKVEDFVHVYPEMPENSVLWAMDNYAMQLSGPLGVDECRLTINSNIIPSPLLNHLSVVFDIDIVRQESVPQNDEELWSLIERIRDHKNRVFEASMSDKARELFNR